jgi:hypothetical protein
MANNERMTKRRERQLIASSWRAELCDAQGAWGHRERLRIRSNRRKRRCQEIVLRRKIRPSFSSLPSVKDPSGIRRLAHSDRTHSKKQGTRELPREFPLHYLLTFNSCNLFNLLPYGVGRGCGVGRGLGVTLGVGVGVADGVAVAVAVGVGVGVPGVGVGVGVGDVHGGIS